MVLALRNMGVSAFLGVSAFPLSLSDIPFMGVSAFLSRLFY